MTMAMLEQQERYTRYGAFQLLVMPCPRKGVIDGKEGPWINTTKSNKVF